MMDIQKTFSVLLGSRKPLIVLIGLFIVYFTVVAFLRHDNFYSLRFDLGNMDQTVWNVLHGNGFTLTDPMGVVQESRIAVHADFLLVLLAPLYLVWSNPKMLLLVQAVVLGLGALPLYWLSTKKLRSKPLALIIAAAYLLYPSKQHAMLYDFHAVALSGSFLLFSYWYLEEGRWWAFVVFALLAALGKEQIWFTVALMGMYVAVVKKRMILGISVAALSGLIFYLLFWKVIPAVSPSGQHFALVYLSQFGGDQNMIIKNILIHPDKVTSTLWQLDRLYYLFQLFSPVGLLPFMFPLPLLFAAPSFAINLLSDNGLMRTIDFQYNSVITPFLFISLVEGLVVMRGLTRLFKRKNLFGYVVGWLVICTFVATYLWGDLPIGSQSRFWLFITPQKEGPIMSRVIAGIGPQYSVSVTNNIGAHLSERKALYNFPIGADRADYILAKLDDPYAWPSIDEQKKTVDQLFHTPTYELIASEGTFWAFRKTNL